MTMKILVCLIALSNLVGAQNSNSPRIDYPMRDIRQDSQKFKAVFTLVSQKKYGMTGSDFLKKLKEGEKFDVDFEKKEYCKNCNGSGKIADTKSNSRDKKSPCQECSGVGNSIIKIPMRIIWSPDGNSSDSSIEEQPIDLPPSPPTKDYPMRDIPVSDERFQAVFNELLSRERISNKSAYKRVTIIQNIAIGRYLVTIADLPGMALLLVDGKKFADHDEFDAVVVDSGELFEYQSINGAKKTVRIYIDKPELTPVSLIERLKSGETYEMNKGFVNLSCVACKGSGMIATQKCQTCWGSGKNSVSQPVLRRC